MSSAQEAHAASRQQLRAAARRFVRRHRRDAGYLAWVLRSVGASSALAVALLGLGATPAHAGMPLFSPLTGVADPFAGVDSGANATVTFGDLDGDGDLDALEGEESGNVRYYQNTGSATAPSYFQPNNLIPDVADAPTLALGDLDADGDLDVIAGTATNYIFVENTGNATSPVFVARTGSENPLNGVPLAGYPAPALGDLDGDGDLDVVAGGELGGFAYVENTGDAAAAAFVRRTGAANPLGALDASYAASPALGDLDGDGDPDLVTGASDGTFAVHYLPERGHRALLGAGAALLAWLRRLRGKRHP